MEWYNGAMDARWTIDISPEGIIEKIVFRQFNGRRLNIYTRNPSPQELLLSEKTLQDAFEVAINTFDDQQIYELSKILKGRDATILESVVKAKIEQCIELLVNLRSP